MLSFKKISAAALALIFAAALSSCHVMLIGAYDQVTDESIQKIQDEVSVLMVRIQKNIDDKDTVHNNYEYLKPEFELIEGHIKSLITRCTALPKYVVVKKQVVTLENNIELMERFSKTSFTPATLNMIDATLQVQFSALIVLQNGLKREKTK